MKKSTKKSPAKAKKTLRNLDVKPAKGGAVRGGKWKFGYTGKLRDQ